MESEDCAVHFSNIRGSGYGLSVVFALLVDWVVYWRAGADLAQFCVHVEIREVARADYALVAIEVGSGGGAIFDFRVGCQIVIVVVKILLAGNTSIYQVGWPCKVCLILPSCLRSTYMGVGINGVWTGAVHAGAAVVVKVLIGRAWLARLRSNVIKFLSSRAWDWIFDILKLLGEVHDISNPWNVIDSPIRIGKIGVVGNSGRSHTLQSIGIQSSWSWARCANKLVQIK